MALFRTTVAYDFGAQIFFLEPPPPSRDGDSCVICMDIIFFDMRMRIKILFYWGAIRVFSFSKKVVYAFTNFL